MLKKDQQYVYNQYLQGGGEMGALTRSLDWAKTVVGHPDQWSQSLLNTISIMFNSKYPMFIWWGSELIQFYNDAYRPLMGIEGKHPKALGQEGAECWPEIWPVIKPLIDQVLEGEAVWRDTLNGSLKQKAKPFAMPMAMLFVLWEQCKMLQKSIRYLLS